MEVYSKKLLMKKASVTTYTLTVSLNPASATCTLTYDGVAHTATSATVSAGTIISYSVSHSTYGTTTGTITMDADKTLTCTGTYSTSETQTSWSSPTISSNGTLGGSSFAVYASSAAANYPAYYAFDGTTSNEWSAVRVADLPIDYIFYSPTAVKVSTIYITNSASRNYFKSGSVYGSNNNSGYSTLVSSWSNSNSTVLSTWSISVNSSTAYKYYKIVFSTWSSGTYAPRCAEISASGTKTTTSYTYYWNTSVT